MSTSSIEFSPPSATLPHIPHTHTHSQVMEMRAPLDRNTTLLHYIARVVRSQFPDVLDFVNELRYLEKSSTGTYQSTH